MKSFHSLLNPCLPTLWNPAQTPFCLPHILTSPLLCSSDNYRSEHSGCLDDSHQPSPLCSVVYTALAILTHENDNRCGKITALPPVASVMDLITGRQLELFWGLLQKEDFFLPVGDPCWENCGSRRAIHYRGQPCTTKPSGSLQIPPCQEFSLAPFSDMLIISLPNWPDEFISVKYFQTVLKLTIISAAALPTTLVFTLILTGTFAIIIPTKEKE